MINTANYLKILSSMISGSKTVPVLPKHIQIDITTFCNLKCKMCMSDKVLTHDEHKQHLSFDGFKHIVDAINPVSVNLAANGEPFLNPDVFRMLEYARIRNIETIISSNFILPREMIDRIAHSSLDILKISIDGASKQTYEGIRGNYFDKLTGNLAYFNEIKKRDNIEKPLVRFNFVIMKKNLHEMQDYVEFADSFGVKHLYFYAIDVREFDRSAIDELVSGVDTAFLKSQLKAAQRKAGSCNIRNNISNLLGSFERVKNIYEGNIGKTAHHGRCLLPWLGLYISVQGMTSPCCIMYPNENDSLGNIFKNKPEDIWNGEKMRLIRNNFVSRKNYLCYEGCRHCIPMDLRNLFRASITFPGYIKGVFNK